MQNQRRNSNRKRILFFSEAVSLGHVVRPLVLAQAIDSEDYEVLFACEPRAHWMLRNKPFSIRPIHSISPEEYVEANEKGIPAYNLRTLRAYVREDLEVIREFKPDLIVGDFRLSLAVSARIAGIPYAAITNAHWSPYAKDRGFFGGRLHNLFKPLFFAYHSLAINQLRKEFGFPSLGWDLRNVYTNADLTLYADHPTLTPTTDLPSNHHYLGNILWSPDIDLPEWWARIPTDRPAVYVNLGSSGTRVNLLKILTALSDLPLTVLAATAGRFNVGSSSANVFITDFLSGQVCSAAATVTITSGGSLSVAQSLNDAVPVLGIVSSLDQQLSMQSVQRFGAGISIRARHLTPSLVRKSIEALIRNTLFKVNATRAAILMKELNASSQFRALVDQLLSRRQRTQVSTTTSAMVSGR